MAEVSRYKDTVLLPKTDFPMKGNLSTTEPVLLENWDKTSVYKKLIEKNNKAKKFVMPDGPPYANGNIHIGHVLNKVLKDIVVKFRNMQGFRAEFIPGWDCHGLPIELKVTSALGDKKNSLTKKEIRNLCRKEAQKWIDTQRIQFRRLGVMADWEKPYLTMNPAYEANEVRVLAQIHRNGVFYRGEKPVFWCTALQTALAAAEVEYHDHKSLSVYVKFDVASNKGPLSSLTKKTSFLIWTTTPWTLPANYAISLNENYEYGAFEHNNEYFIFATELKKMVETETNVTFSGPVKTWKGKELEKLSTQHPFMKRESIIILGDHVTLDAGTGCVHTAPGHGLDDYHVGLKYNLPVSSPVDPAGKFTDEVPQYVGQSIWKANPVIAEDLKKSGHLLAAKEIVHSYPHNPRSKTPLIYRATPQWFVKMDGDFELRKKTLDLVENKIQFFPSWGKARLTAMVNNTPDWCLSRQRTWGVPIPVFFCKKCGESLAHAEIMDKIADKMESSNTGIEAYFDTPAEEFVGNHKCTKCGSAEFDKSQDILDVWFDSGVCHTSVQKAEPGLDFPADIYLEGSDQHRGWFQTSLISSVAAYKESPYKALITHGFVNDAQGHKMSKSKGNVIDPAEVIKKYGAEILRLWVAYEDYGTDVSVSDDMFQRVSETYRRVRNTMRFLLGNIPDFDPSQDMVDIKKMPLLDQWALHRLNEVTDKVTHAYENYDFFKVYHALNTFFTIDLSSVYLDILKDRLYTGKKNGIERRSSQTVFYHLLSHLTRMMAPILSFLAEETHKYLPGTKSESIFLETFPKVNPLWKNENLAKEFAVLISMREDLAKKLEDLRRDKTIGSSLDAQAIITARGATYELLKKYKNELREFFIVSSVEIKDSGVHPASPENPDFVTAGLRANGEKCERCWHYNIDLNSNKNLPNICPKCISALS